MTMIITMTMTITISITISISSSTHTRTRTRTHFNTNLTHKHQHLHHHPPHTPHTITATTTSPARHPPNHRHLHTPHTHTIITTTVFIATTNVNIGNGAWRVHWCFASELLAQHDPCNAVDDCADGGGARASTPRITLEQRLSNVQKRHPTQHGLQPISPQAASGTPAKPTKVRETTQEENNSVVVPRTNKATSVIIFTTYWDPPPCYRKHSRKHMNLTLPAPKSCSRLLHVLSHIYSLSFVFFGLGFFFGLQETHTT